MPVFKNTHQNIRAKSYLTDNGLVFDLRTSLTDKNSNTSFLLEQKIIWQKNVPEFSKGQDIYFNNNNLIKKTIEFYKTKIKKDPGPLFKIKPLKNNNLPMAMPGNKIIIYREKNLFKKNIRKIKEIYCFLINKNKTRFLKLNFRFKKAKKKFLEKTNEKSQLFANWLRLHQKSLRKAVAVSLVVGLASIISYSVASAAKNRYLLALDNVLRQIELSELAVENNEPKKALEYYEQALITINNLNSKMIDKKSELYNLHLFIQKKIAQIQGIKFIQNPTVLIDFSVLEEKTDLSSFVKIDEFFYVLDSQNSKIYKMNIKEKFLSEIKFDQLDSEIKKIFAFNDKIIFFRLSDENPGLIILNVSSNQWQAVNLKIEAEKFSISNFGFYENQIYLLDSHHHAIWQANLNDNNQASEFKKIDIKKIGVENPSLLTADLKNIFLSDFKGNLLKLDLNGKIQNWQLDDSIEKLNQINLIKKESNDNLIVLDSFSKKILVFDELGNNKTQITSEEFDDLKDIILDSKEEKIYVLTRDKILAL